MSDLSKKANEIKEANLRELVAAAEAAVRSYLGTWRESDGTDTHIARLSAALKKFK